MKTVTLYKFSELSKKAQQNAIENNRHYNDDIEHDYNSARNVITEFHKIFDTQEGFKTWLDVRFNNVDNSILKLKGLKLRELLNSVDNDFFKMKASQDYQTWNEVFYKPIWDFIEWKKSPEENNSLDFKGLVSKCFDEVRKSLKEAEAEIVCDKYIIDCISDQYFLKNGDFFDGKQRFEN